jgi:hypothetical protein
VGELNHSRVVSRIRWLIETFIHSTQVPKSVALFRAVQRATPEIVGLVGSVVDVNTGDEYGSTALHLAVHRGRLKTIELLCSCGADVNKKDKTGYTPLMLCSYHNRVEAAAILIRNGASELAEARTVATQRGRKEIAGMITRQMRIDQRIALALWCTALASLELPIYIYLELGDCAHEFAELTEAEKVKTIQNVLDYYRRVVKPRTTAATSSTSTAAAAAPAAS